MYIRQILIFLIVLVFAQDAFSLVEYSEDQAAPAKPRKTRRIKRNAAPRASSSAKASSAASKSSGPILGMFDLKTQLVSEDIELEDSSAKVSKYNFELNTELGSAVFLDLKYQMISSKDERLSATSQYQKGNPEGILGLNWMSFGERGNRTKIDIIVGHRWGVMGSEFASSRNDFIVGVQTFKTLGVIAIGLGYTMDLTGNPQSAVESYVGNIHNIKASLGWMVSNDIRMALHAQRITINKSSNEENYSALENDLQFSIVNPELSLSLGPLVEMTLGGHFRTQRETFVSGYEDIKAPQYNALWGNSIYTGLDITL